MRIAIDVSPLKSGHKVRGVGFYLTYLKRALLEFFPEHEYRFFEKNEEITKPVDVVHYPYFDPFFHTLPFIKKHKTVVTVHDLTPLVFPDHFPAGIKGTLQWQLQRFNLQKVDGILTDSHTSKKDIERIVGIDPKNVTVAYLAAGDEFKKIHTDDKQRKQVKEKYHLPDEFILYVGDATWNKNLPRLLQAVKEINVPLVMVGKALAAENIDENNIWNKDLLEVQKLAKENKSILRLGFVSTEDLVVLYNLAKVFVYPSIYEGFGLPILEAMQCGCPVIIAHQGCMLEVGGKAAAYFTGSNTESLYLTIQSVLASHSLRKELTEVGLRNAQKFSWQETAKKTIEAYERVL